MLGSEGSRVPEVQGSTVQRFCRALWNLGTLDLWNPGPLPTLLGRLATALGVIAVYWYASLGLTLAHYDAKAHLVVSRRILDSLTPGWEQSARCGCRCPTW